MKGAALPWLWDLGGSWQKLSLLAWAGTATAPESHPCQHLSSALLPGFWFSVMPRLSSPTAALTEHLLQVQALYTEHCTYSPSIVIGHYQPYSTDKMTEAQEVK